MVQTIELFGNKKLLRVLNLFLENPSREFTNKEISKIKIAKATRIKWIRFLVREKLIKYRSIGIQKVYSLNLDNPVIVQMKVLNNLISISKAFILDTISLVFPMNFELSSPKILLNIDICIY